MHKGQGASDQAPDNHSQEDICRDSSCYRKTAAGETAIVAAGSSLPVESPAFRNGQYFLKEVGCPDPIIAWSHAARFKTALREIPNTGTCEILDYGCGDGSMLAMASSAIKRGVGIDAAREQVAECRTRLNSLRNLEFYSTGELEGAKLQQSFDLVFCMETLEHCPDADVVKVLAALSGYCRSTGRIIISMPVETGVPAVIKWFLRRRAGKKNLSDYRFYERPTPLEMLQMVFAGEETALRRPLYGAPGREYHSHFGFNWRRTRKVIEQHLNVEKTSFSPLPLFGSILSSQVWIYCTPRA